MNHFYIKASDNVVDLYEDHGHFHAGDAGLDLYVPNDVTINPGETKIIDLEIQCEPAHGVAYWLMPRSSITKTPLRMSNSMGLIDAGYRGTIKAPVDYIFRSITDEPYTIKRGTRLFQLVAADLKGMSFELVDELSETTRGEGGFGSTGEGIESVSDSLSVHSLVDMAPVLSCCGYKSPEKASSENE